MPHSPHTVLGADKFGNIKLLAVELQCVIEAKMSKEKTKRVDEAIGLVS